MISPNNNTLISIKNKDKHLKHFIMVLNMEEEKKIFTLEDKKLASMGPDYVVIIPRKLIQYKVIDPEKKYNIHFEEVSEKVQKKED